MNVNGVLEDHGDDYEKDYLTDNIGRYAIDFLSNRDSERPFLMVLALPASHAPFTPAPQYSNEFPEQVSFFFILLTVKTLRPSIKYISDFSVIFDKKFKMADLENSKWLPQKKPRFPAPPILDGSSRILEKKLSELLCTRL